MYKGAEKERNWSKNITEGKDKQAVKDPAFLWLL